MEHQTINQHDLELIKQRYAYLELNDEQAATIFKFEQPKEDGPADDYFTQWELFDFECASIEPILSREQASIYQTLLQQRRIELQEEITAKDEEYKRAEIKYHQALLAFYQTEFLPELLNDPMLGSFEYVREDTIKVEYLRKEFEVFVNKQHSTRLITHFRQYRSFAPNELKLCLLRSQLEMVIPDYYRFKMQALKPVRQVANFLEKKAKPLLLECQDLLDRKLDSVGEFVQQNTGVIFKVPAQVSKQERPGAEANRNLFMSLLLIDKKREGSTDEL